MSGLMSETSHETVHGSAVALGSHGVLLLGDSGSGKSSLAARLIDTQNARLIADDRVQLTAQDDRLLLAPDARLAGLLELRGLGLLRLPYVTHQALALVVRLVAAEQVPRLPEAAYFTQVDISVPQLALHAHHAATPLTILHAVTALATGFAEDAIYDISNQLA